MVKIDMGFRGPLGNDVTIRDGVLYIEGTNHWLEWVHHFLPGARLRERRWAVEIVSLIRHIDTPMIHTIAGHSVGGTVACIAAGMYGSLRLCTYGSKRPPRGDYPGKHYAIKGDIVPHLPPWRPALPVITLDYGKMSWRAAHSPRSYYEQMKKDGIR